MNQLPQLSVGLGDKDHAFEWRNTTYQEKNPDMAAFRTDLTFGSSRYAERGRRIGLPQ